MWNILKYLWSCVLKMLCAWDILVTPLEFDYEVVALVLSFEMWFLLLWILIFLMIFQEFILKNDGRKIDLFPSMLMIV